MVYQKKLIPKKSDNISNWYNAVVLQAGLADYGPAKGTMIIRPYGYAVWELVQKALDEKIKARGVVNAYFPLFIPESFLKKEKEHVKGFAPELAVVTIGGGKELEEKLIVRPTSETIMYDAYSRWISSWRDLPMLINQWNNVVRWEKRTYMFLRTTEFLWQEGHTAHATHEDAWEMVLWAINTYEEVYRDYFAIAGYKGIKSEAEKFAGAGSTISFELLMPDGKALQGCTSHDLGQNFAKVFNIKFQDKDETTKHVWQTSWGFSTRSVGSLILAHGDDNGLRLPPKVAPFQVVVIPVSQKPEVLEKCRVLASQLQKLNMRAILDDREDETMGFKINKWELGGAPVRIELGDKEIAGGVLTLVRRDNGEKLEISADDAVNSIKATLDDIQQKMLEQSLKFLQEHTFVVNDYEEFKRVMATSRGFIKAHWCGSPECENRIKEETKATTRCRLLDEKKEMGKCVYCGAPSEYRWVFGQSY